MRQERLLSIVTTAYILFITTVSGGRCGRRRTSFDRSPGRVYIRWAIYTVKVRNDLMTEGGRVRTIIYTYTYIYISTLCTYGYDGEGKV